MSLLQGQLRQLPGMRPAQALLLSRRFVAAFGLITLAVFMPAPCRCSRARFRRQVAGWMRCIAFSHCS